MCENYCQQKIIATTLFYFVFIHINNMVILLQGGYSPVFVAAQNGHTEVVDILVQAGADIHQATTVVCTHLEKISIQCLQLRQ